MTETKKSENRRPSLAQTFGVSRSTMTPWTWGALAGTVLLVAVGAVLHFTAPKTHAENQPSAGNQSPLQTGFNQESARGFLDGFLTNSFPGAIPPTNPQPTPQPDIRKTPESANEWSPVFLRGGAGLFLGFCVGFAIRSFIKLGSVFLGFYIVSLLMLSWLGWIDINYPEIDSQLGDLSARFQNQFESFKAFLAGSIPTTGVTAAGFYAGIKKK